MPTNPASSPSTNRLRSSAKTGALSTQTNEATIAKYRPTILVEGPNELWQPLRTFFEKHDYILLDGAAADQSPLRDPVWDTIAVPKEKFVKRKTLSTSQSGLHDPIQPAEPPHELR